MTKKTANVKSTHQSLTPEQQQQQLVYVNLHSFIYKHGDSTLILVRTVL